MKGFKTTRASQFKKGCVVIPFYDCPEKIEINAEGGMKLFKTIPGVSVKKFLKFKFLLKKMFLDVNKFSSLS